MMPFLPVRRPTTTWRLDAIKESRDTDSRRCAMRFSRSRFRLVLGALAAAIVWSWATSAAAANDYIDGVITERADSSTVFVQTDTARVLVTLTENVDIRQTSGLMRRKSASAEELIPGLRVRI